MDTNLNHRNYYVVINRKANKNLYFKMKQDGTIVINCPYHILNEQLVVYLDQFIDKIENKYNQDNLIKMDIVDGGTFIYLGKRYEVKFVQSSKEYVKFNDDCIYLYLKSTNRALNLIDKFMKEEAKRLFTPIFSELVDDFTHINFIPNLKIRKMTSKFGVCFYKKQSITLSTMLLHYDFECIKYVILHELAHFIQPNHSKQFYYLVEQYMPNYKEVQSRLKGYK